VPPAHCAVSAIASIAPFRYRQYLDQQKCGGLPGLRLKRPQGARTTMYYLFLAVSLSLFWVLLSGHYTTLILSLGFLSVLIVIWFIRRMDRVDGELGVLPMRPRLPYYLLWLMWQVVLSNIDLVRRILDPALPIRPTWQRLDIKVTSTLAKTLYANSITLTPGTLTTDVRDDHFMVHSLSPEGIEDLRKGEMERKIQRLGI
jgi:multicomponent Na+:H+ antiporter subunit E